MKKILEVLRYGVGDIRFNTDFDPEKDPDEILNLLPQVMLAMSTNLWGGNETAVMAMIRMLSVADLGLCVNREEMIRRLDYESENCARIFHEALKATEKSGGKVMLFNPLLKPSKNKS